jgi:hypothetical protein
MMHQQQPPPQQYPPQQPAAAPAAPNGRRRTTVSTGQLQPPAGPNPISGRRVQHSAPSSRFVDDGRTGGNAKGGGYAAGGGRRSGSVGREREQHAPHTADGLSMDGGGGGGGGGRRPPMYKPYTGKVSSEYQVLGRLKPDLNTDELNSKRANLERVKMFSRNLKVINTEDLQAQAQARAERERGSPKEVPRELTKAQKAREYAKQVPKPRPVARADGNGCGNSPAASPGAGGGGGGAEPEEDDALAQLERQHAEHVKQAALIRAELGL